MENSLKKLLENVAGIADSLKEVVGDAKSKLSEQDKAKHAEEIEKFDKEIESATKDLKNIDLSGVLDTFKNKK